MPPKRILFLAEAVTLGRICPSFDTRMPVIFFWIGPAPVPRTKSLRHRFETVLQDSSIQGRSPV
ncbi:MAG: hypothetical protein IPP35_09245 [Elusimicrobia bacterium]|nr:hypothetical protein [Elusimicrobiota bacterium]